MRKRVNVIFDQTNSIASLAEVNPAFADRVSLVTDDEFRVITLECCADEFDLLQACCGSGQSRQFQEWIESLEVINDSTA